MCVADVEEEAGDGITSFIRDPLSRVIFPAFVDEFPQNSLQWHLLMDFPH